MNFVGANVAMGPDEFVVFIEINIYGSFYGQCFENKISESANFDGRSFFLARPKHFSLIACWMVNCVYLAESIISIIVE